VGGEGEEEMISNTALITILRFLQILLAGLGFMISLEVFCSILEFIEAKRVKKKDEN